jgi:hypothetical protein
VAVVFGFDAVPAKVRCEGVEGLVALADGDELVDAAGLADADVG